MRDLVGLLERDPMLAGAVLGTARSARYATGARPPATLRDAAMRLGLDGLRPLLLEAVAAAYVFTGPDRRIVAEIFEHSVRIAHLCQGIVRLVPPAAAGAPWQDPDIRCEAFACGLFHDVGRVVVHAALRSAGEVADAATARAVADVAHADAGALVAARWGLSPTVIEAVERHHGLLPELDRGGPCVWHAGHLVALAERISEHVDRHGVDALGDDADSWPLPWPSLLEDAHTAVRLARFVRSVVAP